jgi:type I restriction enzyme S subunit
MKNPESSSYRFLAQLCTQITDGTHQTPKYQDQGVIFISAKNIKDGQLDFADRKHITREEHEFLTKSAKPAPGDLLLTKSGSLGDVAVIPELDFEFSIFESLALVKPRRDLVDPNYLYQYIRSPDAARHFHGITTGLAVKHLHLGDLRKLKVFLPPLKHQREIADQLTIWDAAIQKTEQLIAAKERHYSHELSRLFSEDGTTRRKCRLGDISYVPQKIPEDPKPDGVYVLVRLYCKGIEKNERQKKAPTKNGRPIFRRKAGELLVGRQNIHNGGFGIVPQGLDGAFASNAITSLSFDPGQASPEYVFFYLSRPSYYKKLERLMGGTGQKEISEGQLLGISISLPSIRAQTAIASYLNALREEIDLLGQSVAALKTQKRGLMQKLLTGQWRLPVSPPQPEQGNP